VKLSAVCGRSAANFVKIITSKPLDEEIPPSKPECLEGFPARAFKRGQVQGSLDRSTSF